MIAAPVADWQAVAETMSDEVDRLHTEIDRLTEIGLRGDVGTPPFILSPTPDEARYALWDRLGLIQTPGMQAAWRTIRVGVCPQCRGKLDGRGGPLAPWRLCAPCAVQWAGEPNAFGVREV
jgi:hypothetical protein